MFIYSLFYEMDFIQSDQMVSVFVLCIHTAFNIPMVVIVGFSLAFLLHNSLIS